LERGQHGALVAGLRFLEARIVGGDIGADAAAGEDGKRDGGADSKEISAAEREGAEAVGLAAGEAGDGELRKEVGASCAQARGGSSMGSAACVVESCVVCCATSSWVARPASARTCVRCRVSLSVAMVARVMARRRSRPRSSA